MEKKIVGTVFIMGDDINTDVIIPAKYLIYTDPDELAKYAFCVMGPEYIERLKKSCLMLQKQYSEPYRKDWCSSRSSTIDTVGLMLW